MDLGPLAPCPWARPPRITSPRPARPPPDSPPAHRPPGAAPRGRCRATVRCGRTITVHNGDDERSFGKASRTATASTRRVLNELLASHGSAERAWAVNGGNDLFIIFAPTPLA